ncbi:peptidylprolyl isomerase [Candidatus Cloacimonadota bacterium]
MENKILATVNGKDITMMDVDAFIRNLGQQRAAQFSSEEGRQQILHELINQHLFLADAIENKLEETDECKLELDKMKEVVLTQFNVNNTISSIEIEPGEVVNYFAANKAKYVVPESASTSHILVKTEEECNDLYEKIMKKELDFADAAREYSQCPSKQNGGDLGMYARGQMVPEYDAVSFEMEVGEISKPVKTQFGYHIIKLNEKMAASEAKFDDIKDQLRKDILSEKQREVYMNKIDEMKQLYKVEIF